MSYLLVLLNVKSKYKIKKQIEVLSNMNSNQNKNKTKAISHCNFLFHTTADTLNKSSFFYALHYRDVFFLCVLHVA